jgi:DMSO/TMAO reductase YedYZ molybdopterin-dependent catalytic subunit
MTQGRDLSQLESRPIPKALPRRAWFGILSGLVMAPWTRFLRGQPKLGSTTLRAVEGRLTPNDLFFVRSHFPVPNLSLQSWRLRVEGHVARPFEIQMSDLLEAETTRLEAVLECAGFDLGGDNLAASNAEWEGVMMSDLLRRAGVSEGASRVLLQGADTGSLGPPLPSFPFTRIVPLRKCMAPETLVAFKMNGRFLPSEHGFPARALVPGHYATDSVKWLSRIVILKEEDRPDAFYSSGMDRLYLREVGTPDGRVITSRVSSLLIKSRIAVPVPESRWPPGRHTVWGFAWSGASEVEGVEVSFDGGRTWNPARLDSKPIPFTWVRWRCAWEAGSGQHVLLSRAWDRVGNRQPLTRDPNRLDGYELNSCFPVKCTVV